MSELPFPAVTVSSDRFIDEDYAVKKNNDAPVTETNAQAGQASQVNTDIRLEKNSITRLPKAVFM